MTIPIEDAPSTGYGDEAALMRSLEQVPMVTPDEVPTLDAPTQRPDEPLTTGLPTGPGMGTEALGVPQTDDPVRMVLMAMNIASPNNDVMRLLDLLDIQGR